MTWGARRRVIVLALLGLAASAMAQEQGSAPTRRPSAAEMMDDLMWARGPIGGPFLLTDHTGRRRTEVDWPVHIKLVYFGYMFCPDICPTDLQNIAAAIDVLGVLGDRVQPLFITLDPERDTLAQLALYVSSFHPRLVGLAGNAEATRAVADAYKVFYEKVVDRRFSDYLLDHSAYIYLLDEKGRYLGFLPPGTPADRIAEVVRPVAERLDRVK